MPGLFGYVVTSKQWIRGTRIRNPPEIHLNKKDIRKWQNCHSWSSKRYHYSSFGRASYVNGLCSKMSGKLNVLHKSLECLNYFLRTAEEVCFLGQRSLWLVLIGTAAQRFYQTYASPKLRHICKECLYVWKNQYIFQSNKYILHNAQIHQWKCAWKVWIWQVVPILRHTAKKS